MGSAVSRLWPTRRLACVRVCLCESVCVCTCVRERVSSLEWVSAPGAFGTAGEWVCVRVYVRLTAVGGQFLETTFTIFLRYDRISCCWRRSSNEIFPALWFGGSPEQIWQLLLPAPFCSSPGPTKEPRSPSAISTSEPLQLPPPPPSPFLQVRDCYKSDMSY